MAAGGAFLLAFAVFSMLVMSSLGNPRPLCSDCETLCRTNCTAEVETSCSSTCNDNPLEGCRRQVFERCTTDGTCCSSNGTCACDCNTVSQDRCRGITDNYTDCQACERGQFDYCYSTCKSGCNNNCKKKKGCHA
ncbi:hypothetical protein D1007_46859 [Hordeum vulgare]|nr:hypothetical protein D1007_46859 [Hordeum vulgare]